MHRALWVTGSGLMAVSLLVALVLPSIDPLWAAEHVTLLAAFAWVQQAALVLGAALFAAGHIVVRVAPPRGARVDTRPAAPVDWFA